MHLSQLAVTLAVGLTFASAQLPKQAPTNGTYSFPTTHNDEPQSPSSPLSTNSTLECHDIGRVPRENQCQFALDQCDDYEIGFFNYVTAFYCSGTRTGSFFLYAGALVSLFTTLGITASEFLCPNLDTISKFFRMSESLAGVTLLALGNGSPDVFSTLEAMKIGSADLAIGELVGAALFITAVVVGTMAIVKPFKVVKRPFIRDVLFLIGSLTLTTVFLSDGEITIIEAVSMILLYGCYVIFVLSWDFMLNKRRRYQLIDKKARNRFVDEASSHDLMEYEVEEDNEVNDEHILNEMGASFGGVDVLERQLDQESVNTFDEWTRRSMIQKFRPSILGALEINGKMQGFQDDQSLGAISLDTLAQKPHSIPMRPHTVPGSLKTASTIKMSPGSVFRDETEDMTSNEYEARTMSSPAAFELDSHEDDSYGPSSAAMNLDFNGSMPDFIDAHNALTKFLEQGNFRGSGIISTFFPTLKNFSKKSVSDKTVSLLCLPTVSLLRLSIPVVGTAETHIDDETLLDKAFILLVLQCLFSPLIGMALMFYDGEFTPSFIVYPLIITGFLLTLSFFFRRRLKKGQNTSVFSCSLAVLGFIIAISWISAIATELIAIIKFFAVFLNLSDAILGVTVFAIGNSLGDFISNFTIAKMGFPTMALSACFGGPLLNILLGIGGSSLYVIPTSGSNISVDISKTLVVSGVTLFINLVGLLVIVPSNGWMMNKQIGMAMIGLWCAATIVCVVLELIPQ